VCTSLQGIYVKLPSGVWIRVKGKFGGIIASGKKSTQAYTLVAESIPALPFKNTPPKKEFYVASTAVTRFIYRLVDEKIHERSRVVIEYLRPEVYVVRVYSGDAKKIYSVADEMGIVKGGIRKQRLKA